MKTKWLSVLACAAAPLLAADSCALTPAERAYLIEQLEQSKKNMLASIQRANGCAVEIQTRAERVVGGGMRGAHRLG